MKIIKLVGLGYILMMVNIYADTTSIEIIKLSILDTSNIEKKYFYRIDDVYFYMKCKIKIESPPPLSRRSRVNITFQFEVNDPSDKTVFISDKNKIIISIIEEEEVWEAKMDKPIPINKFFTTSGRYKLIGIVSISEKFETSHKYFEITTTDPPPRLISPVNISIPTNLPTFQYSPVDFTYEYRITVSKQSDLREPIWEYKTNQTSISYPVHAEKLLPGHKYYWRVHAITKENLPATTVNQGKSEIAYFIIQDTRKVQLISPPSNAVLFGDEYIDFRFSPIKEAAYYKIKFAQDKNFLSVIKSIITTEPLLRCFITNLKLTHGKSYYWRVEAYSVLGDRVGLPSDISSFILQQSEIVTEEVLKRILQEFAPQLINELPQICKFTSSKVKPEADIKELFRQIKEGVAKVISVEVK